MATATTAKKTTARKRTTATTKATAPKPKTEKVVKPKFVAPPKPTVEPTSMVEKDYGYIDAKGNFRFWQGYDAKLKKQLMEASRVHPQTAASRKARATLIDKGWSTVEREDAMVQIEKARTERIVEKAKAKAAPKATKKTTKKETVEVTEPVADQAEGLAVDAEVTPEA